MATESRLKPSLLVREISAEGVNHTSLAQRARTMARIRSWAESPSHNFGPGFQSLNNCFLSTWRAAPGIGPSALLLKADRLKGDGFKPGGLSLKYFLLIFG
jgi:hypothetical protein